MILELNYDRQLLSYIKLSTVGGNKNLKILG
jgi:hypothetical protein